MPPRDDRPVLERIRSRCIITDSGCWEWQGYILYSGYGRIGVRTPAKRIRYTHRVAWEAVNGPVPEGLVLDHLCRNRACANPDHLEAVTQRENVMRGRQRNVIRHKLGLCGPSCRIRARERGPMQPKTHCIHGHPFDEANTYIAPKTGHRGCRICRRNVWRAIAEAQKRERVA